MKEARRCGRTPRRRGSGALELRCVLLVGLFALAPFVNSVRGGWVWEDTTKVRDNRATHSFSAALKHFVPGRNPQDFKAYIPAAYLSYCADYHLWGVNAAGYHVTNLFLHAANSILVLFLLRRLINRRWAACAGALLFAVHPVHTEVVSWIKNRPELLGMALLLLSWILFDMCRRRNSAALVPALLLYAVGIAAKPVVITLGLVLATHVLFWWPRHRRRAGLIAAALFVALIPIYLALAREAIGTSEPGAPRGGAHLLAVAETLVTYVRLGLFPIRLCADRVLQWRDGAWGRGLVIQSIVVAVIAGAAVWAALLRIVRPVSVAPGAWAVAAFAVLLVFLTLGPASNLKYLGARPVAEQRMYLPSLGFVLGLALCASASRERACRAASVCAALVVLFFAGATQRNFAWRGDFVLWRDSARKSPNSRRTRHNLGLQYMGAQAFDRALAEYRAALEADPGSAITVSNIGNVFAARGAPEKALGYHLRAAEMQPDLWPAWRNLAVTRATLGQWQEAENAARRAVAAKPQAYQAQLILGNVLRLRGQPADALGCFERAIRVRPDAPQAHHNMGLTLHEMGRRQEALAAFRRAIDAAPALPHSYAAAAAVCRELRDDAQAVRLETLAAAAREGRLGPPPDLAAEEEL